MKKNLVKIFVEWSHGFKYTINLEYPTKNRMQSFIDHFDKIERISYYKFVNSKNEIIMEKS